MHGGEYSNWKPIYCGVPKGSVIGPLPFKKSLIGHTMYHDTFLIDVILKFQNMIFLKTQSILIRTK